jgi:hypothetical protein
MLAINIKTGNIKINRLGLSNQSHCQLLKSHMFIIVANGNAKEAAMNNLAGPLMLTSRQ